MTEDPRKPSPQELARIQGNVAKMRAAGAPESDVAAYLQHEDSLTQNAPAPTNTDLSFRNLGRSFTQGATFGFGDEMGLTNRDAENAFKAQHPIADFASKMLGGSIAPIAATVAAPEVAATAGGAALMGGVTGALQGAGDADGSIKDRLVGGGIGGLLGAVGGAVIHHMIGGAGTVAGKIADRTDPERAVARSASTIMTPDLKARLAAVDQIAPGGASIATAAVPQTGETSSRFLPMLRAVGADPKSGALAERNLMAQKGALDVARKGLGSQMDALDGELPITADARGVLGKVREVLGSKAPSVPAAAASATGDNPLGIEMSVPFSFGEHQQTLTIQDARDALSRLRYMERQAVKRGTEANGPTLHEIASARAGLQSYIYDNAPGFEALDKPYATASDQLRRTSTALKTVQRSRANYAGNDAFGATSGSLGGSLPRGSHGVVMDLLDHILTNRAGAADAVARRITAPGGPQLVDQLLSRVPSGTAGRTAQRIAAPTTATMIPALRGLLFPADSSP